SIRATSHPGQRLAVSAQGLSELEQPADRRVPVVTTIRLGGARMSGSGAAQPPSPLSNRVIAVAETRELDVFASLLERGGARVLRYPLVQIVDAPDPAPVLRFIEAAIAGGLDDLVLLTGEGFRRLLSCAQTHRPELRAPFLAALERVRKITRGPKPARA